MNHRSLLAAMAAIPLAAGTAQAAEPPAKAQAKPSAPAATPAAAAREKEGEGAVAYLKAPLFDERFAGFPIARVDDEVIELRELLAQLAGAHEGHEKDEKLGRTDHTAALDRLVDVRLIVLEARDSGMDELPEVAEALKSFRESALTSALRERATRGAKADPKVVDQLFKDAVREWKVKSALFPEEKDAQEAAAQIQGGKSFDEVVQAAISGKKAHGGEEAQFVPASKMLPHVAAVLQKLEKGQTSPALKVQGGFTLFRLDDTRYPEDPKARAQAEAQALGVRKAEMLKAYYQGMVKRYVKVDEALFKSIDYESAKPGLEALKKDKRTLVRITGEKPITVAQLTAGLEKEFFHGFAEAAKSKRVNKQKATHLDSLISKVVVQKEARRLGLDQTAEYKEKVAEYERSVLFGTYVEKAIVPGVKVEEKELQDYYQKHKSEYSFPAFYKLETLGFYDVRTAQAAVDKLRAGTDFKWLKTNAEGQLKSSDLAFELEGATVSAKAMPPELAKALSGARKGDYRLHSEGVGHYVVHVVDEVPASEQPYEQARASIAEKLSAERIGKAIHEAGLKLREAHEVRIFITRIGS